MLCLLFSTNREMSETVPLEGHKLPVLSATVMPCCWKSCSLVNQRKSQSWNKSTCHPETVSQIVQNLKITEWKRKERTMKGSRLIWKHIVGPIGPEWVPPRTNTFELPLLHSSLVIKPWASPWLLSLNRSYMKLRSCGCRTGLKNELCYSFCMKYGEQKAGTTQSIMMASWLLSRTPA